MRANSTPLRSARLSVAVAVVVTSLVAVAAVGVATAPTSSAAQCADVLFIGARGSGQSQNDNSLGYVGLAKPVATALDRLRRDLPSTTLSWEAVQYPADHVQSLYRNTDKYFTGLSEGVSNTQAIISRYATDCPNQQLVLSGYSQGAMVMHRVLLQMQETHSPTLARVAAVVLFGDGDRVRGDTNVLYGPPHPGLEGIGQTMPSQSGSSPTKFTPALGGRVRSVCLANDPVCDSTGLLGDLFFTSLHFRYPQAPQTQNAVDDAAADVTAAVSTAHSLKYVTFTGAGGLTLGMTQAQAQALYPDLTVQTLAGGCSQWTVHDKGDPTVQAYGLVMPGSGDKLARIVTPDQAQTDQGVGYGSTTTQVSTAYGRYPKKERDSQVGHVTLVQGDNTWLGFTDNAGTGRVNGITVATTQDLAAGFELCSNG